MGENSNEETSDINSLSDNSGGTLLDELDSLLHEGLIDGLVKTPTLITATINEESFFTQLNALKQKGFQFTGIIGVPSSKDFQELKYFFTVNRDMEILVVLSIIVDQGKKIRSITDVYPSALFFEERISL
ncbi:MAG: hypothetical protein ACTSRU_16905 [Candidatus Hodarchaeales archaeon]